MTADRKKFDTPPRIRELLDRSTGADRERILLRELAFTHGRILALVELAERTQREDADADDYRRLVAGVFLAADQFDKVQTKQTDPN